MKKTVNLKHLQNLPIKSYGDTRMAKKKMNWRKVIVTKNIKKITFLIYIFIIVIIISILLFIKNFIDVIQI